MLGVLKIDRGLIIWAVHERSSYRDYRSGEGNPKHSFHLRFQLFDL